MYFLHDWQRNSKNPLSINYQTRVNLQVIKNFSIFNTTINQHKERVGDNQFAIPEFNFQINILTRNHLNH